MVVAYHETGHALVAAMQSHSAPVQKIAIIPRTSGALGYTMQVDTGDKYLMTKEEIENKIATYTGGRAAEEVIFGEITTGASNDIEQATKLARAMITRYGMSNSFGMVALETVKTSILAEMHPWPVLQTRRMRLTEKSWHLWKSSIRKPERFLKTTRKNSMNLQSIFMRKKRSRETSS